MTFSPTVTHESQEIPGVRFTVHRMGYGRRVDLDQKTLPIRQRMREISLEYPELTRREVELSEQLDVARKKAISVDPSEVPGVIKDDIEPLAAELKAASSLDIRKQRAAIEEEHSTLQAQMRCAWIREGLISIEGGEVDGMTADALLADGPPALAMEIYVALSMDGQLTGEAAKNLQSPGTSGAVAPAATTITTAADAGMPGGTPGETVSSTTQTA